MRLEPLPMERVWCVHWITEPCVVWHRDCCTGAACWCTVLTGALGPTRGFGLEGLVRLEAHVHRATCAYTPLHTGQLP